MTHHGMLICSFTFKKRNKRGEDTLPVNESIRSEDGDVIFDNALGLFKSFCDNNESIYDDEKKQKVFSIKRDSYHEFEDDFNYGASFVIRSGNYGVEGDITNRLTSEVSYHRTQNEADVKEFCCVVFIPKDMSDCIVNKGILVFQSISVYGVKTITVDAMKKHFAGYSLTFQTRSVSVRGFLEKILSEDKLYKITFFSNKPSNCIAENLLINTGREEISYLQPKAKKDWMKKILDIFENVDNTGVIEFLDNEPFDDISFQFDLGNKKKTVRLGNLEKLSIIEDIPDHICAAMDDNYESIIKYMIKTAEDYKSKMVFESNH